jgi:hypothetical protein
MGIHRAELLIFLREPEGQVRDRARRCVLGPTEQLKIFAP